MANEKEPDSHFTVFIRLPFPRGDFIDPPPVNSLGQPLQHGVTDMHRSTGMPRKTELYGMSSRARQRAMISIV
jgi:hypothetical protein